MRARCKFQIRSWITPRRSVQPHHGKLRLIPKCVYVPHKLFYSISQRSTRPPVSSANDKVHTAFTMVGRPPEFTEPDPTESTEPTGVVDLDLYESSDSETENSASQSALPAGPSNGSSKRPHSQLEEEEKDEATEAEEATEEGGFVKDGILTPVHHYDPTLSPLPPLAAPDPGNLRKQLLSERQQERLLSYLDEEIMRVRRKYVQRFSDTDTDTATPTPEPATTKQGYENLTDLLADISQVIDVIWYSITSSEPLPNAPTNSTPTTAAPSTTFKLFGQQHALLTIAAALPEYLSSFIVTSAFSPDPDAVSILRMFQKLDQIFARLIDTPGGLTRTERVRLESIAELSRVEVVSAFEKSEIDGFRHEIMSVYEQVLDRLT